MDSLKKLLSSTAPWLAGALSTFGGPGGIVAGKALTLLSSALGSPPEAEAVAKALVGATPEQLAKVSEAEVNFKLQMTQLGFSHETELETLAVENTKSARQREKDTGDSLTPRIIAFSVLGGFLVTVFMLLGGYADNLKDPLVTGMIGTVVGYISSKADTIVGYYFGSSSSSARKTELLNPPT